MEGKDPVLPGGSAAVRRRVSFGPGRDGTVRRKTNDDLELRARFEESVTRQAKRFGLKALVDLLLTRGYGREQILFQANTHGEKASIVESVQFRTSPFESALVTVNIGALGDGTLLPAYMVREIERSRDPDRFYDFLRFFDHRLIENYLRAVWPEDDPAVYGNYALVQQSLLKMGGFSSISSLHWLSQSFFPELRVRVERGAFEATSASFAFRTGESKLDGTGILGRVYEAVTQGFRVVLVAEEETDDRGRSWATVVRERLRARMLPVLAPFRVPLSVCLEVLLHSSWVQLEDRRVARGYLGYERIRGNAEEGHRVIVWRGTTGAESPDET